MNKLLCIEKIILESLKRGRSSIESICEDTGLQYTQVTPVVQHLMTEGFVLKREECFEALHEGGIEVDDIVSAALKCQAISWNEEKSKNIFMKKLWVTEEEKFALTVLMNKFKKEMRNIYKVQSKRSQYDHQKDQMVFLVGNLGLNEVIEMAVQ